MKVSFGQAVTYSSTCVHILNHFKIRKIHQLLSLLCYLGPQILEEAVGALPSSDTAIRQAADWIYDRAFGHLAVPFRPEFRHLSRDRDIISRQVASVLHFIHDDKFEVR